MAGCGEGEGEERECVEVGVETAATAAKSNPLEIVEVEL